VHVTAFCLGGGGVFFRTRCTYTVPTVNWASASHPIHAKFQLEIPEISLHEKSVINSHPGSQPPTYPVSHPLSSTWRHGDAAAPSKLVKRRFI